jgi:hypothetical protein
LAKFSQKLGCRKSAKSALIGLSGTTDYFTNKGNEMIDLQNETIIPIKEIPLHTPGKKVDYWTAWRWVQHGARGHRLDSVLIGRRRYTSLERLASFFAATTAETRNSDGSNAG